MTVGLIAGVTTSLEALLRLDPANSRMLGEHFRELAEQLLGRARLDTQASAADERRRARNKAARMAAQRALAMIERGKAEAEALAAVAAPDELEQVTAWLAIEQKKAGQRLRLRNRQIMRLAARGWHDAEIGRKFGMHRKSVNRIVRRMLRDNPPSLPGTGER